MVRVELVDLDDFCCSLRDILSFSVPTAVIWVPQTSCRYFQLAQYTGAELGNASSQQWGIVCSHEYNIPAIWYEIHVHSENIVHLSTTSREVQSINTQFEWDIVRKFQSRPLICGIGLIAHSQLTRVSLLDNWLHMCMYKLCNQGTCMTQHVSAQELDCYHTKGKVAHYFVFWLCLTCNFI